MFDREKWKTKEGNYLVTQNILQLHIFELELIKLPFNENLNHQIY